MAKDEIPVFGVEQDDRFTITVEVPGKRPLVLKCRRRKHLRRGKIDVNCAEKLTTIALFEKIKRYIDIW